MKKIGEYTILGHVTDNTVKEIRLFDGRFDTGYKVVAFEIFPRDPTSGNSDAFGCLATEAAAATSNWNAADNRQIGWSSQNMAGGYAANETMSIIDPDNLIIEDLFIFANDANDNPVNYIITLEKYDISEWQGALAMVRNSAQNV